MSPAEFLNIIVVDILKKDLSGGKVGNHGCNSQYYMIKTLHNYMT